jgi:hypothetical protein
MRWTDCAANAERNAARRVHGAGDGAVAPQLADVANVDQYHVGVVANREHLVDRQCLNFLLRLGAEFLDAFGDHCLFVRFAMPCGVRAFRYRAILSRRRGR